MRTFCLSSPFCQIGRAALACAALAGLASCSSDSGTSYPGTSTQPTIQPTRPPSNFPVPASASGPSQATLVMSNVKIIGPAPSARPSFTLTETGGQSGAWIDSLVFSYGTAQDVIQGDGCFLTEPSKHVTAGGTWTTDLVYLYCLDLDNIPESPVVPGADVLVAVTYLDDFGHRAVAFGSAPRP